MIREDYGIKAEPITVRNPQANAIVERIHQVIGALCTRYDDRQDESEGVQ